MWKKYSNVSRILSVRFTSGSLANKGQAAVSVKHILEELFQPINANTRPTIVEASGKIKADYAYTSAMEIFRSNPGQYSNAQEVASTLAKDVASRAKGIARMSVSNFYVNMILEDEFLSQRITNFFLSGKGSIVPPTQSSMRKVIIDYSSPNIAKQMHVGHLRSTLIGNCLANVSEYIGNETIRVNHLGDWGTQFGTLLQFFIEKWGTSHAKERINTLTLQDITRMYKEAKAKFESDDSFADKARACTVRLQAGKEQSLVDMWKLLVDISLKDFNRMYARLGVWNDPSWFLGESFYQDKFQAALKDLEDPYCTKSPTDSSVLLYSGLPEAKFAGSKPGEEDFEVPLILRKSDGGLGYDATDVAAIRYRLVDLGADEIIYVTDSGQSLHFQLIFHAAKLAGWARPDKHKLSHVTFGVVTKGSGGRIRTREGDAETLDSLLNKAADRIFSILQSKRPQWTNEEKQVLSKLSEKCGICCVAFAELKTSRTNDYEFSVERMCSPDGNSGLFVIHVLRKSQRILSKAKMFIKDSGISGYDAKSASPKERSLVMDCIKFHDVVEQSWEQKNPHVLAMHVLSVAAKLSSFVEDSKEPILAKSKEQLHSERGLSRIAVVQAAQNVINQELKLLGMTSILSDMEPMLEHINEWPNSDALL